MKDVLSTDYQIDYMTERIRARVACESMTPAQRFGCLLTGQEPDRLQIAMILVVEWGARYLGYRLNEEFAWDPKKQAAATLVANDRLEDDLCCPFYDPYVSGPDAQGAKVLFHENSIPEVIDPPVKSPSDISKLKPFDMSRGRSQVALEAAKICQEKIGDIVPLLASICGPFSWAANLRGIYHFLADLKQNPQFAKDLIEIGVQGTKETIKAYNAVGIRPFLADAVATNYLISPAQIDEFYFPVYERLQDELGVDAFCGAVWGYYSVHAKGLKLPVLRTLGWWNYNYNAEGKATEEEILEAKRYRDEFEPRLHLTHCLWGKWVQSHTPKEIDEEVKRYIGLVGPEWPFMVGMQSLPFGCPIENVDAYIQGIKKYGRFPLAT